jgi:uncharacterized iron-regulated membrane protein
MCPACLGSALLLLTGTTSTAGLAAFIAGRVQHRPRWRGAGPGRPLATGTAPGQVSGTTPAKDGAESRMEAVPDSASWSAASEAVSYSSDRIAHRRLIEPSLST